MKYTSPNIILLAILLLVSPIGYAADTIAPTPPVLLDATTMSSFTVRLQWDDSARDNVEVKGYKVYANGQLKGILGSRSTHIYYIRNLTPNTIYAFGIKSFDAAGNHSVMSNVLSATTQYDITPLPPPIVPKATVISPYEIKLEWRPQIQNSKPIIGFGVFQDNVQIASVPVYKAHIFTYSVTNLTPNTTYTFGITTYDAAGNHSVKALVTATTTSAPPLPVQTKPAGIYSVDYVVDKPYVDGVLCRLYWASVEKTEGVYDFGKLDKTVRDAMAVGQTVSIATLVVAEPQWLLNKTETFTDPQYGMITVPWDTTMLTDLEQLIDALSNHTIDGIAVKDHPAIKQVDAAIGGIQSVRMLFPPSGYTAAKLTDGVIRSVTRWSQDFPNKFIYVGLFGVQDGVSNPSTTESIRDTLLVQFPGVNFFQEVWSGSSPAPTSPLGKIVADVKDEAGIMYQACGEWSNQSAWSWCNWATNDTPDLGFNFAYTNFNSTYFEVYKNDLLNTNYESQFQQWHDFLLGFQ